MKISVIVPVYNVEQYLEKCLESLINQTCSKYEIICIDDCSTDASLDILKMYGEKYDNIRILTNQVNRGLSYNRNLGVREAIGKYVLFVDSDDWLTSKETLEFLYEKAEKYNADLLRYRINGDNLQPSPECLQKGKICFARLIKEEAYRWESVRNFVQRTFLEEQKISFDEDVYGCEDALFTTLCILKAQRCMEINEEFYFYNRHIGSITKSQIYNKNVKSCLKVMDQLYDIFYKESDKEIRYCILEVIQKIGCICKNNLWNLDENLNVEDWDKNILKLYDIQFRNGILTKNHAIFSNWELILNAHQIYIYGIGKAAEEVFFAISSRRHFSGAIVSNNCEGIEIWNNVKVYELGDNAIDKQGLILVCVTGNAQREIDNALKKEGYSKVLLVGKMVLG